MLAPQACVAVEIAGPAAADDQRAALERRCSEILGAGRCRIWLPEDAARAGACWHARVSGPRPGAVALATDASVTLDDPTEAAHAAVRRDITFRPNDAPAERWATLGLVIAALVTVEEHSAADADGVPALGPEGSGFAPVVTLPPQAPAPPPWSSWRAELRATGVGALGALPRAALGARLEIGAGGERLAVLARGTLFPASTRAALGAAGAGGTFDLWSLGLGLCGLAEGGRWRARLCGGGELAHMSAQGYGVAQTAAATAWWQAAWVGASASRRVAAHLALVAEVEGAVLFQRPTFAIESGQSTGFSPAPVTATVALGVAVPLP